jgi:hypothetical protein
LKIERILIVVIQLTKKMLNLWLKMVVLANHLLITGLMVKQQLWDGGDAEVSGDTRVFGDAQVSCAAQIYGDT